MQLALPDQIINASGGRQRIVFDLGAFLVEPKRAALLGIGRLQLVNFDDDPGDLGAQAIIKVGHRAHVSTSEAQDVFAQVLDGFDRLDNVA